MKNPTPDETSDPDEAAMTGPYYPVPPPEVRRRHPTSEQLAARRDDDEVREKTRDRKIDTRRKVLLGGALIAHARSDPAAAAYLDQLLRNWIGDRDRKVFDGWHP